MSNNKVKIGVIGCGFVAKMGHLPAYYQSPLSEIVAISDPLESHLKQVQDKYKISKVYTNPSELLEDPDIDAVSICSPHWAHAEQAIHAAKNGKHILCEKPIATNLEDVDKMINAVEKNDIIFQTATQKRFDIGFQYIKQKIEEKDIGDIFHASVDWYHSMSNLGQNTKKGVQNVVKWRLTNDKCGGGDLLDHGPHYFDLFRWWFGDVKTVSAQIRRIYKNRVNEDHGTVLLSFKDCETIAVFQRSEAVLGPFIGEERGKIHGTKGSYYFDVPYEYLFKTLTLKKRYKKTKISRFSEIEINFPKDMTNPTYTREIHSFINQVLGSKNNTVGFPVDYIPTIYDGKAALEIVLAAYESQRTQTTIHLPLKHYTPLKWCSEEN
jgi:UDP-N-acetyl-2-amino-2-deoxyglucuronate dehydrogenase